MIINAETHLIDFLSKENAQMVKALISLPNGTEITIDGTTDEVQSLMDHYGKRRSENLPEVDKERKQHTKKQKPTTEGFIDVRKMINLSSMA